MLVNNKAFRSFNSLETKVQLKPRILNNVSCGVKLLLIVMHMNSFRIDLNSILNLLSSEQSQERNSFILVSKQISEKAYLSIFLLL